MQLLVMVTKNVMITCYDVLMMYNTANSNRYMSACIVAMVCVSQVSGIQVGRKPTHCLLCYYQTQVRPRRPNPLAYIKLFNNSTGTMSHQSRDTHCVSLQPA